jgi:hypothetical protein
VDNREPSKTVVPGAGCVTTVADLWFRLLWLLTSFCVFDALAEQSRNWQIAGRWWCGQNSPHPPADRTALTHLVRRLIRTGCPVLLGAATRCSRSCQATKASSCQTQVMAPWQCGGGMPAAIIVASRFTAFWRRSHAFVSPRPAVIKRLWASSQAGRQRTAPGLRQLAGHGVLPDDGRGFTVDLTTDLSWCRPDPASRLRSHGR